MRSYVRETAVAYGERPYADMLRARLRGLIEVWGSNRVAELLGVSRSQPSRWQSGKEGIAAHNAQRLLDLDFVTARLLAIMRPPAIDSWLEGSNAWLGGARPIDVLRRRGALAILSAVEAEEQHAYH